MPALDPTLIDDEDVLARHDSRGVLRSLATAGAQVREAVRLSSDAGIAGVAGGSRPRSVLVAATGGTAIVGDALGWFAGAGSPVPIDTRSHGPLPGWVGSLDLVIAAVSYTHLDVYKRQAPGSRVPAWLSCGSVPRRGAVAAR